jgi:hypothetical protein
LVGRFLAVSFAFGYRDWGAVMRHMRLCQQGLAIGLASLAILSSESQAIAQNRHEIGIAPNIPHSASVSLTVAGYLEPMGAA